MGKSRAEYMRDYRQKKLEEKLKSGKFKAKKIARNSTERSRDFRARAANSILPQTSMADPTKFIVNVDQAAFQHEEENGEICRTCLVTSVKMYDINKYKFILDAYEKITDIKDLGIYTLICYECVARLRRCEEFRLNCYKALETLTNMKTTKDIQIDRKLKCLESPLKVTIFNVFDYSDIEQSNEIDIKIKTQNNHIDDENCIEYTDKDQCNEIVTKIKTENEEINDDYIDYTDKEQSNEFITNIKIEGEQINDDDLIEYQNKEQCNEFITNIKIKSEQIIEDDLIEYHNTEQCNEFITNIKIESEQINDDDFIEHHNKEQCHEMDTEIKSENEDFTEFECVENKLEYSKINEDCINYVKAYDVTCEYDEENITEHGHGSNEEETMYLKNKPQKIVAQASNSNKTTDKLTKLLKKKVRQGNNFKKINDKCFDGYTIITEMTPQEAKREIELRKDLAAYKTAKFRCNLCYKFFGIQKTYDNHMKRHSLADGNFQCEICFVRYRKKYLYNEHMSIHKRKFSCIKCPYICFNQSQAVVHMKIHKGVKYTCDECQKTFSLPQTLLWHQRVHSKNCVCAFCGDGFVKDNGLKAHIAKMHREELRRPTKNQGPKCIDCDITFTNETAWKRHLVLSEKHQVSNGCKICGQAFPSDEELRSHLKSHNAIERYGGPYQTTCYICNELVLSRAAYLKHFSSKHPGCGDTEFIKPPGKKKKIRKKYACDTCGKICPSHAKMVYHKRTHTGVRPYRCQDCERSYYNPTSLLQHRRTHHNLLSTLNQEL